MDWTKVLEKIEAASRELRILPENEKNEFLKKEEKGLSQNNEADFQENVELNQAEHMLLICREQVTQKGEDFYLMQKDGSQLLMGVFDGCGGSGAKVYSQFGNQTGARVASRTLAKAVKEWFEVQKISKHPEEKRAEQESN